MSSTFVELLNAYRSNDDTRLRELLACIENQNNTEIFSSCVDYVVNPECDMVERKLALTVLRQFHVQLRDEDVIRILQRLCEPDAVFIGLVAATVGPLINERTLNVLLSLPHLFGVAATCIHIHCSIPPANMLARLMDGTNVTDNYWTATLCARALSNFEPEKGELTVLKKFVYDRFSIPLANDFFPLQCELLKIVEKLSECPEKFQLCFRKLSELAEMVPFGEPESSPDGVLYRKSEMALSLLSMVESILNQDYDEYDPLELALVLISLCVASDEELRKWQIDIECFVTENFFDQRCPSLRTECAEVFMSESLPRLDLSSQLIPMFVEFGKRSERCQEAVYFIMAYCSYFKGFVPRPTTDDQLTLARFVQCTARNHESVDLALINAMLESNQPMLQVTAAQSLQLTDLTVIPPDFVLKAINTLASCFEQFQSSIIVEVIDIFHELGLSFCRTTPEIIPHLVQELLKQWERFACDKDAAKLISSNISVYFKDSSVFSAMSELVLSRIILGLSSENTAGASFDLLFGLFCQLPKDGFVLSEACFSRTCQAFLHALELPYDNSDLSVMCCLGASFVRMNVIEPFSAFSSHILETEDLTNVNFCDLAIALITRSSTRILSSLVKMFLSIQCPDVSEQSLLKISLCTIFAFAFSHNPTLILSTDAPWMDIVTWMADNIIQVSCAKLDSFLWFNMSLSFPNATANLLSLAYKNAYKYLNISGAFPQESLTFHFTELNPDILNHPFAHLSVREFFRTLLSDRSDVPDIIRRFLQDN